MNTPERIAANDPLGVSAADVQPHHCPLSPTEIVAAWNELCQDNGPLSAVLVTFAEELFRLARAKGGI